MDCFGGTGGGVSKFPILSACGTGGSLTDFLFSFRRGPGIGAGAMGADSAETMVFLDTDTGLLGTIVVLIVLGIV